jgi:hypothetical protein
MAERRVLRPAQALIAGIGLAAILSAGASATSKAAFPTQLTGVWQRTVTAADLKRAGAKHAVAAGAYTMDIEKAKSGIVGNVYISTGTGRNVGLGGTLVPLKPGHLYIVVGFPSGTPAPPNDYTWKVAGKQLAFARVRDANPDRAAFFVGVWEKAARS